MVDHTDHKWTFNSKELRSTFDFETFSDAKLAELCLDDQLNPARLERALRVILDPEFKFEDVMFKSAWDICRHVSDCRKENTQTRNATFNSSIANDSAKAMTWPTIIPPVVLDLLVDILLDEREPLDVVAGIEDWEGAFRSDGAVFRDMSLVHRSWTPYSQRGLRSRIIVQDKNVERFLLSPLCGPRVTEMVVYWTVTRDRPIPTVAVEYVRLLKELLIRNPNIRSLAFNTNARSGNIYSRWLDPAICIDVIAEELPRLEKLLLWHSYKEPYHDFYDGHSQCPKITALCAQLPKLLSLKSLSIRGWKGDARVDWKEHPPAQLKAIKLDYCPPVDERHLEWLIKPRGGYNLESLSISIWTQDDDYAEMAPPKNYLSKIKKLALHVNISNKGNSPPVDQWCQDLLRECKELVSLKFFAERGYNFIESMFLPPSLERLSVHYLGGSINEHFPESPELTTGGQGLVALLERNLPRLLRLRTLNVTAGAKTAHGVEEDGELVSDRLPHQLLSLCRNHGVEVKLSFHIGLKMVDYIDDKRTYKSEELNSTLQFKSYSDAKLAELCVEGELTVILLERVLRVFFNPMFKLEDLTFKRAWDICRYVSDCRKRVATKRAVAMKSTVVSGHIEITTRSGVVPRTVLELVVETLLDEQMPIATMYPGWRDTFYDNCGDLRTMSLVHRSWTPVAQECLRKRIIVQDKNIEKFLLSPLCGPQVTGMVIYWTFEDGRPLSTERHIWLLDELLLRNPNVRALAFRTSTPLSWDGNSRHQREIETCMNIIAERLPVLEDLWLRHQRSGHCEAGYLNYCPGIPALCAQLPKMFSLKSLFIREWGGVGAVDWNEHPPAQLKAVEFHNLLKISSELMDWLLRPRGDYNLQSFSIHSPYSRTVVSNAVPPEGCLSKIKRLELYLDFYTETDHKYFQDLLDECEELVSLNIHAGYLYHYVEDLCLPSSLEHLSVHYYDGRIDRNFPQSSELTRPGKHLLRLVQRNLPHLPRFRTLLVTTQKEQWHRVKEDGKAVHDNLPERLLELCRDHGVEIRR